MIRISLPFFVVVLLAVAVAVGLVVRRVVSSRMRTEFKSRETSIRRDSNNRSRSVLKGRINEQMATLLPEFPFDGSDARFLGNPVDYIVFCGYGDVQSRKSDRLDEVVFVEVKHGRAQLTREERRVRDCIENGRVRWQLIRMDLDAGRSTHGQPLDGHSAGSESSDQTSVVLDSGPTTNGSVSS